MTRIPTDVVRTMHRVRRWCAARGVIIFSWCSLVYQFRILSSRAVVTVPGWVPAVGHVSLILVTTVLYYLRALTSKHRMRALGAN